MESNQLLEQKRSRDRTGESSRRWNKLKQRRKEDPKFAENYANKRKKINEQRREARRAKQQAVPEQNSKLEPFRQQKSGVERALEEVKEKTVVFEKELQGKVQEMNSVQESINELNATLNDLRWRKSSAERALEKEKEETIVLDQADLFSKLINEKRIGEESNIVMLRTELVDNKRLEFTLPETAVELLRTIKTRPETIGGNKHTITGNYETLKIDVSSNYTLFKILKEYTPFVRVAESFFAEYLEEPQEVYTASSVKMISGTEQVPHADSIGPVYLAITILLVKALGTRFCNPRGTLGPDLTSMTRKEMVDFDWGSPQNLREDTRLSGRSAQILKQCESKFLKLITDGRETFDSAVVSDMEEREAGLVTMFVPDIIHFGPGGGRRREILFTTLRPISECEQATLHENIQWNSHQALNFTPAWNANSTAAKNTFKTRMRELQMRYSKIDIATLHI